MKRIILAGLLLTAAASLQASTGLQQDTTSKKHAAQHKKMSADSSSRKMKNANKVDSLHSKPMNKSRKKLDSTSAKQ